MKISPHFSRSEFACGCGCGFDTVDYELLNLLEAIRIHFDSPLIVNSGARCEQWNKKIGGYPKSQHLKAKAADIVVHGVPSSEVAAFAEAVLGERGGIGRYETFTHVDVRAEWARW